MVLTHEENSTTGEELAQVATIVNENVRITQLSVTTVGLTLAGRYRYEVYGQNSAININPSNAAVVGIVERGYVVLTDNTTWFDVPPVTIPNDIIYDISPTETPFMSSVGKTKATAVYHEWQTDSLAAATTGNAAIEGADATSATTATIFPLVLLITYDIYLLRLLYLATTVLCC